MTALPLKEEEQEEEDTTNATTLFGVVVNGYSNIAPIRESNLQWNESKQPSSVTTFDMYPISCLSEFLDQQSLNDNVGTTSPAFMVVHFVRHAEGTHNVNKDYRNIKNLDARLTAKGMEQCFALHEQIQRNLQNNINNTHQEEKQLIDNANDNHHHVKQPSFIVTSTMTRCIQTAYHSFENLITTNEDNESSSPAIPFVAHENIRETVNYACDRRRPISHIRNEFPMVDFSHVLEEQDSIWNSYQNDPRIKELSAKQGTPYDSRLESAELHKVAERGRDFFHWLFEQNYDKEQTSAANSDGGQQQQSQHKEVIVCSHSAFFRCIFGWGQNNGGVKNMPPQTLDDRLSGTQDIPIFKYHETYPSTRNNPSSLLDGTTTNTMLLFEEQMRQDYANCEMRSCIIVHPHITTF